MEWNGSDWNGMDRTPTATGQKELAWMEANGMEGNGMEWTEWNKWNGRMVIIEKKRSRCLILFARPGGSPAETLLTRNWWFH